MNIIFGLASFAAILAIVLVWEKIFRPSFESVRKLVHLLSGLAFAALPFFLTKPDIVAIALILAGGAYISKNRKFFPSIHVLNRRTHGEVYFPLGVGLAALLMLPGQQLAFQFGVLVLGVSDAVAAIFGHRHTARPLFRLIKQKTRPGTMAFFATTVVIALSFPIIVTASSFFKIVFIALVLTVVEAMSTDGFDNLALPIVGSYLFSQMIV